MRELSPNIQKVIAMDSASQRSWGKRCILSGGMPLLLLGIILSIITYSSNPERLLAAYHIGFIFVWALSLGCLFFVALHHATGAVWSVVIRRVAEFMSMGVPLAGIIYLPLLFLSGRIFPWLDQEFVAHSTILQEKTAYLNFPFFAARGIGFFLLWILFAIAFFSWSLHQDRNLASAPSRYEARRLAPLFLLIFAFSLACSAVDWLMSLDPLWFSSLFLVYVFAGVVLTGLASLTLAVLALRRSGLLGTSIISADHLYNLGGLLFAFSCFWGYIALSQYLLIWYGNLPEETIWYVHRQNHGAAAAGFVMIALRFALPFVVLISRPAKKSPTILLIISICILAGQWVDLQWLVMPAMQEGTPVLAVFDLGPLFVFSALFLMIFGMMAARHPLLPKGDPNLASSLQFEVKI